MPFPQSFDQNEWFIIIGLILSFSFIVWLPKRFPMSITILILLIGIVVARLYDHLLSSPYIDLYNIMDSGKYEVFDLVTYFLYAPFSYIFVYLYEWLNVKGFWILIFIVACSFVGTMFEGLNELFNVFNYHGWRIYYSFSVYLVTQSLTLLLYTFIKHVHYLETGRRI